MYCRNCGRFIEGDEQLCEVCKQNVAAPVGAQPQQPVRGSKPRMLAFKPSLAAAITGVIGYVFMLMAYIYAIAGFASSQAHGSYYDPTWQGEFSYDASFAVETLQTLSWVFFAMAIPLCVVGLVFGIRSLITVVKAKKQGAPMAIAPLILSICAIVMAALGVFFGFLVLCLCGVAA